MEATPEKRTKKRARASTLAQCRLIDFPSGPDGLIPMVVGRIADISTAGLRLDFPGELFAGVKLRIDFVTETGNSASILCEVVRVEPNSSPTKQLTGHGLKILR